MFDMPPVNEYDMYMRSFGQSNAKQVLHKNLVDSDAIKPN